MKHILFTLILITMSMTQVQAQTTDIQSIETTIGYYLDAMTTHNVESLEKAFEPSASMKWVDGDKYQEVNAVAALGDHIKNNPAVKIRTSIISVNVVGDGANVQLELEYETFSFIDLMHLLKVNGEWKIVSKTYTTVQKDF